MTTRVEGLVYNGKKWSKGKMREELRANYESLQGALHAANQKGDEARQQLWSSRLRCSSSSGSHLKALTMTLTTGLPVTTETSLMTRVTMILSRPSL